MMKQILKIGLAFALLASALPGWAQTIPSYTTLTASGSTTATVVFATSPFQQVRIVTAFATSDLSTSKLAFRTGVTPLTVAYTNGVTQVGVSATNGFAVGTWVLIETKAGATTNAQIASFGAATNIIFTSNAIATTPGDQIYSLSAPVLLTVGSNSVTFTGDALYVGNRGRPVMVYVNGTSACSLDTVSGRYE